MGTTQEELLNRIYDTLVRNDRERSIRDSWSKTFFNEQAVATFHQQIMLNAALPLSNQRGIQLTSNGGSITSNDSSYSITASSSANSTASLETVKRSQYKSGSYSKWGIGLLPKSLPLDTAVIRAGLFKNESGNRTGMYYRIDKDGIWAVVEDASTSYLHERKQSEWNLNNLIKDKYGNLNLLDGNMLIGSYGYYGFVPFKFEIGQEFELDGYGLFDTVPVHMLNRKEAISLSSPNLPLTIEVDSGANGEAIEVEVGGRQAGSFSAEEGPFRTITGIRRTGSVVTSTAFYPVVAWQGKAGFEEIQKIIQDIKISSDEAGIWRIVKGDAPTGGTMEVAPYGYLDSETGTHFDVTCTTLGAETETIDSGTYVGGSRNNLARISQETSRELIEGITYTLECQSFGNTAIVQADVPVKELW